MELDKYLKRLYDKFAIAGNWSNWRDKKPLPLPCQCSYIYYGSASMPLTGLCLALQAP